jgi:hypothetical protein
VREKVKNINVYRGGGCGGKRREKRIKQEKSNTKRGKKL